MNDTNVTDVEILADAENLAQSDDILLDDAVESELGDAIEGIEQADAIADDELVCAIAEGESQLSEQEKQDNADGNAVDLTALWQEVYKNAAEKAQQKQKDDSRIAMWSELFRRYPDLQPQDISMDVYRRVNAGEPPLSAMQAYQLEQAERQIAALKQNETNAAKDIGSVIGDIGDEGDSFLSGFLGL